MDALFVLIIIGLYGYALVGSLRRDSAAAVPQLHDTAMATHIDALM
jgi:hypothetical protein